jgi:hypothetical protein
MARRTRKLTPTLIAESQVLVRSMQSQAAVLYAWHPDSMALTIVIQQLSALAGEFEQVKTEAAPVESTANAREE